MWHAETRTIAKVGAKIPIAWPAISVLKVFTEMQRSIQIQTTTSSNITTLYFTDEVRQMI